MLGAFRRVILASSIAMAMIAMPAGAAGAFGATTTGITGITGITGVERTPIGSQSTPTPPVAPGLSASPTTIETSPTRFTPTGSARISGTKAAGNGVTVTLGAVVLCTIRADQTTSWNCGSIALPDGANLHLVATESVADQSATPGAGSVDIDSLAPPTLDGPSNQLTTGIVSGSGHPGSLIRVSVDGTADTSCSAVPVGTDSAWSCNLAASVTGQRTVRAQQSNAEIARGALTGYSNLLVVTIDRDAAPAAMITSPAPEDRIGTGPLTVTGAGEDAASIDVYLDNVPACATLVSGTTWSCTIGSVAAGNHSLQALQRDEAGNFSAPSSAVTVIAETVAAVSPLGPSPSATPDPAPGTTPGAIPSPSSVPKPTPEPSPTPSEPATVAPGHSDAGDPAAAPPSAGPPAINWDAPTDFGSTLTTASDTESFSPWFTGPLIALVFISLIALPLRLLATSMRGRLPAHRPHLTGRNRSDLRRSSTDTTVAPVRLWKRILLPILAIAFVVMLTGGISGEVRYVRLLIAVGAGLAILNLIGMALGARLGSRMSAQPTTLRFVPLMFVAAVVTAVASRVLDIDPPLVAGVIVAPAFALGVAARARAIVNLVPVAAILLLGVGGWLGHSALASATRGATGFWPEVVGETLATLCLAGLGSALLLVLPIASLPGRVILEWSPIAWVATVLVVASVAGAITLSPAASVAAMPLMLASLAFAALSVAVWAWIRYVEPAAA